jgi:hypothetical protein
LGLQAGDCGRASRIGNRVSPSWRLTWTLESSGKLGHLIGFQTRESFANSDKINRANDSSPFELKLAGTPADDALTVFSSPSNLTVSIPSFTV